MYEAQRVREWEGVFLRLSDYVDEEAEKRRVGGG
jgi:hypothetical protein